MMNESKIKVIIDEENANVVDDIESLVSNSKKSQESNDNRHFSVPFASKIGGTSTASQVINQGKKKKTRRSRLIISDNNDASNEHKKEIYDPVTKVQKASEAALLFNETLNSSRRQVTKHFLKRKIKAAFEREPLEKSKSFFNIPFLPNQAMFTPPQSGYPGQGQSQWQNKPVGPNPCVASGNPSLTVNVNTSGYKPQPMPSVSNVNPVPRGSNTMASAITNPNNPQSKLFNINQDPVIGGSSKESKEKEKECETKASNCGQMKVNTEQNGNKHQIQICLASTQPTNEGEAKNKIIPESEIKLEFSGNHKEKKNDFSSAPVASAANSSNISTSNSGNNQIINNTDEKNTNNNPIDAHRQQQMMKRMFFNKLYEAYRTDPEKLKREIGESEFIRLQNYLAAKGMIKQTNGHVISIKPPTQATPSSSGNIAIPATNSNTSATNNSSHPSQSPVLLHSITKNVANKDNCQVVLETSSPTVISFNTQIPSGVNSQPRNPVINKNLDPNFIQNLQKQFMEKK